MFNPEQDLRRCEDERTWYAGEVDDIQEDSTSMEEKLTALGVLNSTEPKTV
jgi:hypothetical protein